MKRIVVAVVLALSLVAGTGTASLAGPPQFVGKICQAVVENAPGLADSEYNCEYLD